MQYILVITSPSVCQTQIKCKLWLVIRSLIFYLSQEVISKSVSGSQCQGKPVTQLNSGYLIS